MKEYIIEIHRPNENEPFETIKSETPFMHISKGDFIEPNNFVQYKEDGNILQVVNLEHIFYGENPTHKILIYTKRVVDTQALRFS